jgi:hypothetical protein
VKLKSVFLSLLLAAAVLAQTALTNDAVTKMVKAGLSEDIVLGTIKSQPAAFTTGADDLIALKSAGVSDKIIGAMVARMSSPAPVAAPAAAAATAPTAGLVSEVGLYFKKADVWTDLPPEVVNFKTGGVLKSIGTAGIVKGDINGHVEGEHSKTSLKTPVDILVYTPEGTAITEYQLLLLHDTKDSREFRTVTGGVMHVSGGATRDLVPFESKKLAPRTYEVILPNLGAGEYGFLPPSGAETTGRIGKIYSFHIIE